MTISSGSSAGTSEIAPRVLVVEDDYLVALQAEAALSDAGFEVVGVAVSAEEAVTLAATRQPAVAIMDIRLAGTRDGIDAALEIFRRSGIRSIFATAHNDPHTRARAAPAQPLGWLPKPYTSESLVEIARRALANLGAGSSHSP